MHMFAFKEIYMGNENDNDNDYNLYTEKIVESPVKKYRKIIKFMKYTLLTIFLSMVAGFVFYFTVKYLEHNNENGETTTKQAITIPDDEYTKASPKEDVTESQTGSEDESQKPSEGMTLLSFEQKAVHIAEEANKSIVTVQALKNTSQIFGTMYELETVGICIVKSDDRDYIITKYDIVKNADSITISGKSGRSVKAEFIAGDSVTNIAVISVDDVEVYTEFGVLLTAIPLGNTGFVSNMSELVAVGNVCNGNYSMNYGMATNISNVVNVTDMCYTMINTNIGAGVEPSGMLVNANGEMVGLITDNYSDIYGNALITAYGVSSLKSLFEQLANGRSMIYVGIEGNEVTSAISEANGLPKGVYVTEVMANSPAHLAGVQVGDIIVGIENDTIETFAKYRSTLFKYEPGDTVTVTVARRNKMVFKEVNIDVTLQ